MVVGFLGLVILGLATRSGQKNGALELAFLIGAVIYFVWLGLWTRWK